VKALAVLLTLIAVAMVAPALALAYIAVFGGHITDEQINAAMTLLLLSGFPGLGAYFIWAESL
jgi:hypothetical protein